MAHGRWMLLVTLLISLLLLYAANAATLQGSVYNEQLELERDVLLSVNTVPKQQLLARNGTYAFDLPPGEYVLTVQKGTLLTREEIVIGQQGTYVYVYDVFLLPDFVDEEDLWAETQDEVLEEEAPPRSRWWAYAIAAVIILVALYRYARMRKKYGPLWAFRRKAKEEQNKSIEQHKEEIAREPGYLERALDIIRKNDGRMTQKELRREMLDLSEAKVSLILTELEHKGKIEKIKKGRGNVVILK